MDTRVFKLSLKNPIISPLDLPFQAAAVLNPGATEQGNDVVLLLRIEDHAGFSNLHIARSKNGVTDWKVEPKPILAYGEPEWQYEEWGCEDGRITFIPEDKCWYITYTAYSPKGAAVALARSYDLFTAERIGLILSPSNKDAVLFPQKIRWQMGCASSSGCRW
jgi:beta-1,4-mannooligosaccharide/beta-1,4-mannosyl-N-acetylglucosamine phosphorylase